ncbi:hypothetical protein [Streptacidiphilus sp. PAMC 29251]
MNAAAWLLALALLLEVAPVVDTGFDPQAEAVRATTAEIATSARGFFIDSS